MQALLNSGYHLHEADAAITLMQHLARKEAETLLTRERSTRGLSARTMTREERERFTVEAFSFVLKLTHLDVITIDQREELIEKAMNHSTGRIDLEFTKTLITYSLFAGSLRVEYGEGAAPRRIKNTAWN